MEPKPLPAPAVLPPPPTPSNVEKHKPLTKHSALPAYPGVPVTSSNIESKASPVILYSKSFPMQPESTQKIDPMALVDSILDSMKSANIAFNAPQKINISETVQIQLLLSMKKSIDELKREIVSSGQVQGESIKVTNRMGARLTGSNFQITAITDEEQAVGSDDTVEWRWDIKPQPQAKGRQNLHLTLSAIFEIEGKTTHRSIRTLDKTIEVEVTAKQLSLGFIRNNWQWLWAVVLAPIVAWFWKRRKSAKSANAGS